MPITNDPEPIPGPVPKFRVTHADPFQRCSLLSLVLIQGFVNPDTEPPALGLSQIEMWVGVPGGVGIRHQQLPDHQRTELLGTPPDSMTKMFVL
jgi:hypothetical protein